VFQFESEGMKNILRRLKPDRFEDLVAINALYRPGPIGGGLIDDFIKRRHGKIKVEYPHPLLAAILAETYGVIVYQEQVMQIASAMAGYSLGEADILRRAMGKKKKEVMAAEREKFIERATAQKVKAQDAGKVFDQMEFFAGYGFNKSHSAAYALVAYRTAWLKAHYPFISWRRCSRRKKGTPTSWCNTSTNAGRWPYRCLPPDVNASGLDFTVEGDSVRFGLSAIKNVGEGAIESLVDARAKRSRPFRSMFESGRRDRPASGEQARVRGSGAIGRARFVRSEARSHARRRRRRARVGSEAPHRPRVGPGQSLRWRREPGFKRRSPGREASRSTRLGRANAPRPREGDPGLLHERPSARERAARSSTTSRRTGRRCSAR
jgi:DNA polymerase III alpha subunit